MSDTLRTAEEARERNESLHYLETLGSPENASESDNGPDPLTCFTVQVFGAQYPETWLESAALARKLRALMAETEENLNAGVMPGFTFKIREWDETEEEA
jgi:hypothetical protein